MHLRYPPTCLRSLALQVFTGFSPFTAICPKPSYAFQKGIPSVPPGIYQPVGAVRLLQHRSGSVCMSKILMQTLDQASKGPWIGLWSTGFSPTLSSTPNSFLSAAMQRPALRESPPSRKKSAATDTSPATQTGALNEHPETRGSNFGFGYLWRKHQGWPVLRGSQEFGGGYPMHT
jgi:hypothetical protein